MEVELDSKIEYGSYYDIEKRWKNELKVCTKLIWWVTPVYSEHKNTLKFNISMVTVFISMVKI